MVQFLPKDCAMFCFVPFVLSSKSLVLVLSFHIQAYFLPVYKGSRRLPSSQLVNDSHRPYFKLFLSVSFRSYHVQSRKTKQKTNKHTKPTIT